MFEKYKWVKNLDDYDCVRENDDYVGVLILVIYYERNLLSFMLVFYY